MRLHFNNRRNRARRGSSVTTISAIVIASLLFYFLATEETRFQNYGTLFWDENFTRVLLDNTIEFNGGSSHNDASSFDLARSQSFGFFDDISNDNWKRAQQIHAKVFPNHADRMEEFSMPVVIRRKFHETKNSEKWYSQNYDEEFRCPLSQRIPTGGGDGPKWVCDPYRLKHKSDCLVYSVGSNGKAEFEGGIKEEIGEHCEIHTFDVTNYNRRFGDFATALNGTSTFHHWGLGTEDEAKREPYKFKTLQETMFELGHEGRTIDLFKIDCEGCEWLTFDQWIQQDLRQILVETHCAPMPHAKNFFQTLHDAGYVIFNKEPNLLMGGKGIEYGFIRLSTNFFVNGSVYRNKD